ncbi:MULTISPECIES: ABC transporter permease [unclassified Breznakia]|uniref:ABC transporter permease n=1 Tax=unclassified Breznakia TaxID=2623764 RepID=UPI0024761436|nr:MULTISPECIES: ABC transporter permease [unclassified Breznakia]MDH6366198.1 putative ABC transport system permease protein [Breznakia sp. PH1-1]MDH6403291.1 putative ABC transport system permease protein [Breznakia sp. PF1-11]MDH6411000.1 putative ABC transport system permease protein [Breznakia sp. PFB1-11]MDH6413364.1 putative ABC transport system permease protein [Breznakia sp. PFB1-14]MDH6416129.1 putative ABC transport system permease protein [Breznakia sp. PFB1-4]
MSVNTILGAIELGLLFSIMSFGVYVTFKVLDFPDLTVDGSFTAGAVTSAVLSIAGHPFLAILGGTLVSCFAGMVTGFLHTKMKVNYILAGILTMTGLYSINLKIAGGTPNLSLFGVETIFTKFHDVLASIGLPTSILDHSNLILLLVIVIICMLLLYVFFKTQMGLALRATGNNEEMVRASSINTDAMKIMGLGLANGFVGLCAAIYTQHQTFYDISQGIGMMVVALTSIIIGESVFGKRSVLNSLVSIVLGAMVYRLLLSFALAQGMDPNDWKLLCASLVAIVISIPTIKTFIEKKRKRARRIGGK